MSIYKDNVTGKWRVVYRYTDWTGKTHQSSKRGFPTKREALMWERELLLKKEAKLDMTFESFYEIYVEDMKNRIRDNTWGTKTNIARTKILPYFGKRKIGEIEPRDIIAWQNELLAIRQPNGKPYSSSYLQKIHSQLSAIFNHAVNFYHLPSNPAQKAGNMGKEEHREMLFWTKEEYLKFADVMMDKPVSYYAFEILYWCGLRMGELLALTPADFNFETHATIMKTSVLAHQEGTDTAALFLEGKLLQAVINVQSYLYKLIEMEEETGNHDKAEKIAEITDQMISLFGLWNYGNTVPYLLIAGYRKNVEKCVQLIKQLLSESQKPWNMTQSPLYYRYEDTAQGKAFSGIGKNFVRELYSEIENKKEYEFLRGNKELESIFEEHLK